MRTLSASEFDKRFDDGEDGMEFLDLSKETIETEYDFSRAKRATEVSHLNKLREKKRQDAHQIWWFNSRKYGQISCLGRNYPALSWVIYVVHSLRLINKCTYVNANKVRNVWCKYNHSQQNIILLSRIH